MSFLIETGLDLDQFIMFGLPFYAFVIFVVLLRRFLSADDDAIRQKRKLPMLLSGMLSIGLLLVSFGHWISYDFASDTVFLAKVLFILWLTVTYIFAFLLYNLICTMPIVEILWFIVTFIRYSKTPSDHDQKRDRKIEMLVSGGIAVIHILIVLVLSAVFL